MKNGVRLGWLIDPFKEQVYIYRGTAGPQTLAGFDGRQLTVRTCCQVLNCRWKN